MNNSFCKVVKRLFVGMLVVVGLGVGITSNVEAANSFTVEVVAKPETNGNFRFRPSTNLARGVFVLDDTLVDDGDAYGKSKTFSVQTGTTYDMAIELPVTSNYHVVGIECTSGVQISRPQDFSNIYVRSIGFQIESDEAKCTYTVQQNSGVSAVLFNDINGNGVLNKGETRIEGREVRIYRGNESTPGVTMTTNINGVASNRKLMSTAGEYFVCQVVPTGWVATTYGSDRSNGNEECMRIYANATGDTAVMRFASKVAPVSPTVTPSPTPTVVNSPTPSSTPMPTPTASPIPSWTPIPSPTAFPIPSWTPIPSPVLSPNVDFDYSQFIEEVAPYEADPSHYYLVRIGFGVRNLSNVPVSIDMNNLMTGGWYDSLMKPKVIDTFVTDNLTKNQKFIDYNGCIIYSNDYNINCHSINDRSVDVLEPNEYAYARMDVLVKRYTTDVPVQNLMAVSVRNTQYNLYLYKQIIMPILIPKAGSN